MLAPKFHCFLQHSIVSLGESVLGITLKFLTKQLLEIESVRFEKKIKTDYSDNTSVKVKMNSRLTFLECVAICLLLCSVNIVVSDENIESQLHIRLKEFDERQAQVRIQLKDIKL